MGVFSLFDLDNNNIPTITGINHIEATNNAEVLKVYDLNGHRMDVTDVDDLPQTRVRDNIQKSKEQKNALEEIVYLRQCSEPTKTVANIYERLKYKKMPFRKIKIDKICSTK